MKHRVYGEIIKAVKAGILKEPFTVRDFKISCPDLGDGTYSAFLYKHRTGNPSANTELFERVSRGRFRCVRPFKYGL